MSHVPYFDLMNAAALSPIIIAGAFVLPDIVWVNQPVNIN
jgi:hypothetical protein